MRGHSVPGASSVKALAGLLVVLFLMAPIGSVSAATLPFADLSGPEPSPSPPAGSEGAMPLDGFVASATEAVHESGGTRVLRPDAFPQYAALADDEKRALWQAWQVTVAHERTTQYGTVLPSTEDTSRRGETVTLEEVSALGSPRGLRGLWTLDVHGTPREVLSGGDGAYFLITDLGVLRFDGPDARPSWMIKTGSVHHVETTDANGDGAPDLVLSMSPWFVPEGTPNLLVVDGRTGDTLLQAFAEDDRLAKWALTDVDGDGAMDLVGLTVTGEMVGAKLDGTILWSEPLPREGTGAGMLLFSVSLYYLASTAITLADVDGNGVLDLLAPRSASASAYAFLVSERVGAQTQSAWSGVDGRELWTMVLPMTGDYSSMFPVASGDLDGDGNDDVAYSAYSASFYYLSPAPVSQTLQHQGILVLSGKDGTLLADDRGIQTYGFPLIIPVEAGQAPYLGVVGFEDLDRDGTSELVTLEIDGPYRQLGGIDVVGRGAPTVAGPTEELWRQTIDVTKPLDVLDLSIRFRDTDGDGRNELRAHLSGYKTSDEAAVSHTQSTIIILTAEKVTEEETAFFTYDSDIDTATGQAYAWTLDDRWVRLDDVDGPLGLDLITSGTIRLVHDINGDRLPDLLVSKSSGMRWLDGGTGRTVRELERPMNRQYNDIVLSDGRPVAIERDWFHSMIWAVDAVTGNPLWTIDGEAMSEERDGLWPASFRDFDGDGRIDLLARAADYDLDPPVRTAALLTLPDLEETWRIKHPDGNLQVRDVLARPGLELILDDKWYNHDGIGSFTLYVPGEDGPRWSYDATERTLQATGSDRIVIRNYDREIGLEILDATTGALDHTFPIGEGVSSRATSLLHVDRDGIIDLVWEVYEHEEQGTGTPYVQVHSLADGSLISRFKTVQRDDGYGAYPIAVSSDGDTVMVARDVVFYGGSGGFREGVPDWDGDAHDDLLFVEDGHAVVRSGASGEILAVSSGRVQNVFLADLNGDGRQEIGTLSALGRLRFQSFAEGWAMDDPPQEIALRVAKPDEPQAEDTSFFEQETGLLPALGAWPLVALLVGLLGILVRRRR